MPYALADKLVKQVVAVAADANGGNAPIPNYIPKLDLPALIAREKERAAARIDGVYELGGLRLAPAGDGKTLAIEGDYEAFSKPRALNAMAEYHLATKMGVPSAFYAKCSDRLKLDIAREHGAPFAVKGYEPKDPEKRAFIRINDDGRVRAILSPGYAVKDNVDVLEATLALFQGHNATAAYLNIGETFFHGRVLFPTHEQVLGKGERLVPGAQIRNSEVGMSSLSWSPALFRVSCWNGIISPMSFGDTGDAEVAMQQRHSGKSAASAFENLERAMTAIIQGLPGQMSQITRASEKAVTDGQEFFENAVKYGVAKTAIPALVANAATADAKTAWDYINVLTASAQGLGIDGRITVERAAGAMLARVR